MTERPASHRARIRCQFPLWDIQPADGTGHGWTARRPLHSNIWAVSLTDLENRLHEAEHPRKPQQQEDHR